MMDYLIPQQIAKLQEVIEKNGFSTNNFSLTQKNGEDIIYYLPDSRYYFQFRDFSLTGLMYRDVFYYYYDAENIEIRHLYLGCNSFIEALTHFTEWIESLKRL